MCQPPSVHGSSALPCASAACESSRFMAANALRLVTAWDVFRQSTNGSRLIMLAEREPRVRKHRRVQLECEKAKKKFAAAGGSLPYEAKVKKEPKAAAATPKKKKRPPQRIPQSHDFWIQDHAQAILKEFPKSALSSESGGMRYPQGAQSRSATPR